MTYQPPEDERPIRIPRGKYRRPQPVEPSLPDLLAGETAPPDDVAPDEIEGPGGDEVDGDLDTLDALADDLLTRDLTGYQPRVPPETRPMSELQPRRARLAASGAARRPSRYAEPAYEDDDSYYDDDAYSDDEWYYEEEREPLLRNPYVLAAAAVFGAIILAVVVAVAFSGTGERSGLAPIATATGTPDPEAPSTINARSVASATVYEGPGTDYLEIGVLRSGQDVQVVGRNEDATWYQIYYPANSRLPGWVPAAAIALERGDALSLPLADITPIARPTVAPTLPPTAVPTEAPVEEDTPTPEPSAPDLSVAIISSCTPGTPVVIRIANSGDTPIEDRGILVTVVSTEGILGSTQYAIGLLLPGQTVNLPTGQVMRAPRTTVQVDLLEPPLDADPSDNAVDCVAQGGSDATPEDPDVTSTPDDDDDDEDATQQPEVTATPD